MTTVQKVRREGKSQYVIEEHNAMVGKDKKKKKGEGVGGELLSR